MKKRFILLGILIISLLIPCAGQQSANTAEQQRYTPERKFLVEIINNGKEIKIVGYKGRDKNVNIPPIINNLPVTVIGVAAFEKKQLTSVIIPNSVTIIEDAAFYENQLTSVVIPNSVTHIGHRWRGEAFKRNQLTSVVIPNSVTYIGMNSFEENKLTSVIIPNSVTHIGNYAFRKNQLTSIIIPNSVTEIGGFAFDGNQITSVVIPDSVTSIGSGAFDSSTINIYLPDGVRVIDGTSFPRILGSYYITGGKKAGHYTYNNNRWHYNGTPLGEPVLIKTGDGIVIVGVDGWRHNGRNFYLAPGFHEISVSYEKGNSRAGPVTLDTFFLEGDTYIFTGKQDYGVVEENGVPVIKPMIRFGYTKE